MTDQQKRPVTIGDVAELRAYGRMLKLYYGKTLDLAELRAELRETLEGYYPDELIDVLALCCDAELIEAVTTRAVTDFHRTGDI